MYIPLFFASLVLGSFGFFEKYYFFKKIETIDFIILRIIIQLFLIFIIISILKLSNNNDIFNLNKLKKKINKKYLCLFIIYCFCHLLILYTILTSFKKKPAYKVSQLIQISIIISTSLLGYFVFKEKYTKYNILGIFLALISLCLILC